MNVKLEMCTGPNDHSHGIGMSHGIWHPGKSQTSPSWRKSILNIHWKDRCWSWSSNTLATWCKELSHCKRPWCWERLKAGGEGDDREWDGWIASLTQWTWVWTSSGYWWQTEKPGVLQSKGSQRVRQDWVTERKLSKITGYKTNTDQKRKTHCFILIWMARSWTLTQYILKWY